MKLDRLLTSDRERRLWLWTAAVLVAIYSTMGAARLLAEGLRERNLLEVSMTALLVVVGAVIFVRWAKTRPDWREIGVAIAVTWAYLMVLARIPHPEERTHLMEYGLVAILIHKALIERRSNGRHVPAPAVLAMVATALLGLLDESIQAILPSRVWDLRDVGFNALAGFMVITASVALGWARRRWGGGSGPDTSGRSD